jgi:hypothetical protein
VFQCWTDTLEAQFRNKFPPSIRYRQHICIRQMCIYFIERWWIRPQVEFTISQLLWRHCKTDAKCKPSRAPHFTIVDRTGEACSWFSMPCKQHTCSSYKEHFHRTCVHIAAASEASPALTCSCRSEGFIVSGSFRSAHNETDCKDSLAGESWVFESIWLRSVSHLTVVMRCVTFLNPDTKFQCFSLKFAVAVK